MYDPFKGAPTRGEKEIEQYDLGDDFCNYEHIPISHRLSISKYQSAQGLSVPWTQENLSALVEKQLKSPINEKDRIISRDRSDESKSQYLTSTQVALLRALKNALVHENDAITFDYLGMHIHCLNLLRKLQKQMSKYVREVRECVKEVNQNAE
jgi:hypothetical protein